MSAPTPRTDAIYREHRFWANEDEATEAIEDLRDLARTLELELEEWRASVYLKGQAIDSYIIECNRLHAEIKRLKNLS